MKIRLLGNRILLKREEEEDTTKGGIIIPDTVREKPLQGSVVATGPGKKDKKGNRIPLDVAAGDTVMFSKYSGKEIEFDEFGYVIMTEDDVFGITD